MQRGTILQIHTGGNFVGMVFYYVPYVFVFCVLRFIYVIPDFEKDLTGSHAKSESIRLKQKK
jgi:hypothetical protein